MSAIASQLDLFTNKKVYLDLDSVLGYLNSIPNINSGGCGIAALAIIRWLKKNKKKSAKAVYLDDDWYPALDRAPGHVSVRLGQDYLDATGHNGFGHPRIWEYNREYNERHLVQAVNNIGTWNDSFERAYWTPIIADELGVDLSDVEIDD
jgi:hypothetical protein